MTKRCPACKEVKELDSFSDVRKHGISIKRSRCKPCQKIYDREYERKRRREPAYMEKKRKSSLMRHDKVRRVFNKNKWDYLAKHPCVDCGETDPVVLDFDHRNPEEKKFTIAGGRTGPWEEVYKEIQKCDVRCANCHRRKTAKQLGWYPDQI